MFVDASALVAIITREPDGAALEDRLASSTASRLTSPMAVFETSLAVARKRGLALAAAEAAVLEYVAILIEIVPITTEVGTLALKAWARYGKGSGHPARLNLGDCFSYACAKTHNVPLLYKGDDFVHTDLA